MVVLCLFSMNCHRRAQVPSGKAWKGKARRKARKEGRDAEGGRGPGTVGRPKKEEAEEEEAADTSGVD